MIRILLAMILLGPAVNCAAASSACSYAQRLACERMARLVAERAQAMSNTFGDLTAIMPAQIEVRFTKRSKEERRRAIRAEYDPQQRTLFLPRRLTNETLPAAGQALDYWAFHEDEQLRDQFPVVGDVDAALWSVYLQEAARRSGLSWPHGDCESPDSAQRLPCEMVANGVLEYVNQVHPRVFNTNRLDMIWPEDYQAFTNRLWRSDDRSVADVKRYGGLLLLRPLVVKFGVPWALAYVAQNPFRVEDNNMQLSAHRFLERALQIGL